MVAGAPIAGTDGPDDFGISLVDGGQFEITNFDIVEDSLSLGGLSGVSGDTLGEIVGQTGFGGTPISALEDPFTGSMFVNLGNDAEGEVVSIIIGGVTNDDLSAVAVNII